MPEPSRRGGERDELDEVNQRWVNADRIARAFHAAYEELAPGHGYETRAESAKPWDEVPPENRDLMVSTVERLLRDRAFVEAASYDQLQQERDYLARQLGAECVRLNEVTAERDQLQQGRDEWVARFKRVAEYQRTAVARAEAVQQELEEARRERDRYRRNWRQSMDFTAVEQDAYDAADLRAEAAEAQLQTASERIERLEERAEEAETHVALYRDWGRRLSSEIIDAVPSGRLPDRSWDDADPLDVLNWWAEQTIRLVDERDRETASRERLERALGEIADLTVNEGDAIEAATRASHVAIAALATPAEEEERG